MTRTWLKSWLCASGFISACTFGHAARAAHSLSPVAPPQKSPKATSSLVKRQPEPFLPSRLVALQLELNQHPAPLPQTPKRRHVVNFYGLSIPTLVAYGLSGVSAGGAVATGYAALRGNDPSTCDSRCSERDVRHRALLLTSGVLSGLALAGVGIGFSFLLREPSDPEVAAIRPRLDLGLSGQKAEAKVGWVFSSF